MRQWPFRALAVAVLLVWGPAARAESGTRLYLPGVPNVVAWNPSDSYAGKAQADPRLDRPVSIWRAGITLAQVFAIVQEQTEVEVACWPPDDLHTRFRVNVYLNPAEPPSLRALMVQLAWVADTSFCVTDEPPERKYFLLSTSIGEAAEYSAARRREERVRERQLIWEAMEAKLDEYRRALALSRQEVISRYRGTDDFMALNLLDPARRAAVQLVCRHLSSIRPAEGADNVDTGGWGRHLLGPGRPTQEDIDDLRAAFGEVPRSVQVEIYVPSRRQWLSLRALFERPDASPGGRPNDIERPIIVLPSPRALTTEEEVALRRALGEQIGPEQAAELARQRRARWPSPRSQLKQLAGSALSEEALERLVALEVPSGFERDLVPWQLFEEVAKASGYNIISDAFANGGDFVSLRAADGSASAVEAWRCFVRLSRNATARGLRIPEWEWGDARTFLRFRSSNRDVYRAAMLPQTYLDWVDELAAPYLPKPGDEQTSVRFVLAVDPIEWTRRRAQLTDMQMEYGAFIRYGDPHDPESAIRQALLSSIARAIPGGPPLMRFCGALTDEQWAKLTDEGLAAPDDIPFEQAQPVVAMASGSAPASTADSLQRVVVRVSEPADDESPMPGCSILLIDTWEGDSRRTRGEQFAAKQIEVQAEWPG